MVLMSVLICATDTPKIAGSMSLNTRATPSCPRLSLGRGNNPSRARNGSWNRSCATPAINTPQASAITGLCMRGASHSAAPIIDRFSSTGVKAAAAKRP